MYIDTYKCIYQCWNLPALLPMCAVVCPQAQLTARDEAASSAEVREREGAARFEEMRAKLEAELAWEREAFELDRYHSLNIICIYMHMFFV